MLTRTSLAIALLILCGSEVPASAEETNEVQLAGRWVSKADYVVGYVRVSTGRQSVITLGYKHGLISQSRVMLVRYNGTRYRPLGFVEVTQTQKDRSVVQPLDGGPKLIKKDDIVLIPAERLDLWHGTDPEDDILIRQHFRKLEANGYDTRSRELTGKVIMAEMKARDARRAQFWKQELRKSKVELGRTYDVTEAQFAARVKNDPTQFPTEKQWLGEQMRTTFDKGWHVIPKVYNRLNKDDELAPVLPEFAEIWKKAP